MGNVYCIKTGLELTNISPRIQATIAEQAKEWNYAHIRERLMTRFGDHMPKHFAKCMSKPQKQPYMHGDVHNVSYRIKKRGEIFNDPMPVPCVVTIKSCRKVDGILQLGFNCLTGTDEPFPWMDKKYQVTLNFLKNLPNGTKIQIRTRSDLIATEEYVTELKRLDTWVQILYLSDDEQRTRAEEPGAPSTKRKREANMILNQNGIASTMLRVNPKNFEAVS